MAKEAEVRSPVPVIDLEAFYMASPAEAGEEESERRRRRLLEACEEWGCLRIVNHRIPEELLADMKAAVRCLFDRPAEVKRRNADVLPGSGYVAPSELNPLYEALGLYDAGSPAAVAAFCSQLEATPQQREVISSYARELHRLAMEIASRIAESMGLGGDHQLFDGWTTQFRINKYAFTEATVGSSGVCVHTDSGFLTVLQEDDRIGGLEVMDKSSGQFVAVDHAPAGSLLVNLGDIATAWSNGRLCNLKHRVQCKEAGTRFSIALFLLGPREEAVEPPPALVDPDHPRLYRPFTIEDYRKLRISSGLRAGETLALCSAQHHTPTGSTSEPSSI